jgi:hypothetical protein
MINQDTIYIIKSNFKKLKNFEFNTFLIGVILVRKNDELKTLKG